MHHFGSISSADQAQYHADQTPVLTKAVADEVKDRLKELHLPRYKLIVQVVIGEQRGQGVRVGSRCFWDGDTDTCVSEVYRNETLFCVATAYGIYVY